MKAISRIITVFSSLLLAASFVWFAHGNANPRFMPGSKSFAISPSTSAPKPLRRTMPGPNSGILLTPGKSTAAIR